MFFFRRHCPTVDVPERLLPQSFSYALLNHRPKLRYKRGRWKVVESGPFTVHVNRANGHVTVVRLARRSFVAAVRRFPPCCVFVTVWHRLGGATVARLDICRFKSHDTLRATYSVSDDSTSGVHQHHGPAPSAMVVDLGHLNTAPSPSLQPRGLPKSSSAGSMSTGLCAMICVSMP